MEINGGEPKRVVLVDDSVDEAEFARRAMKACHPDAELLVFRSGAEALAYLREGPGSGRGVRPRVHLVLLDLKLPGLDGHAILEALRARYAPGELPVVVFTSSREPSDVARAYEGGANGFVVKPLIFERYLELVGVVARYWLDANVLMEMTEEEGA